MSSSEEEEEEEETEEEEDDDEEEEDDSDDDDDAASKKSAKKSDGGDGKGVKKGKLDLPPVIMAALQHPSSKFNAKKRRPEHCVRLWLYQAKDLTTAIEAWKLTQKKKKQSNAKAWKTVLGHFAGGPLECVNLSGARGVTEDFLAALARNAKKLKMLVMYHAEGVCDDGLEAVLHHCSSLEILDLRGTGITLPASLTETHCDGCNANVTSGKRRHCLMCASFDLCEECYGKKRKEHCHGRERDFRKIDEKRTIPKFVLDGRAMDMPPSGKQEDFSGAEAAKAALHEQERALKANPPALQRDETETQYAERREEKWTK